jgi:hypothetical protein
MSPEARWIRFTACEFIDATRSHFRWEARMDPGKISSITVIDAYEAGHGSLVVKLGGVLPVKEISGPDVDKAEIQRYLASMAYCPTMLLNHATLECTSVGPSTLRLRDKRDPTGAIVNLEVSEDGCPLVCRGERPRLVGKKVVLTQWSGTTSEFREYDGLRIATRVEAAWRFPEGDFTYFRAEVASIEAER